MTQSFEIWQSSQFQNDQLFLLHKLNAVSWDEFVANGRGERAERALHRVAGFYDRVGDLIRNGLIREEDILPTLGGFAIAVWQRIEPIVQEARRREDAFLFQNFEAVLPNCRECYVPVAADIQAATARPRTSNESGRRRQSAWVDRDAVVMVGRQQATARAQDQGCGTRQSQRFDWMADSRAARQGRDYLLHLNKRRQQRPCGAIT